MNFISIVYIYFSGIIVLFGAVIINVLAKIIKIPSWYEFISKIQEIGFSKAFMGLGIIQFLFLFILYPLLLGVLVFICLKVIPFEK